jgi:hypothetical protein
MDYQKLLQQAQANFTEQRLLVRQWVENLIINANAIDKDLLAEYNITISFDPETTAQSIVPALFEEPFNNNKYKEQITPLITFAETLNSVASEVNKKALEVMNEVNH